MKKTRKGFTIVELVIVIAVIAVLTAILVPTFIHLTKKANEAADHSLVTNLNKALAMREAEEGDKGKNNTMYDCVMDLEQEGYKLPQLATRSEEDLVWSQKENRFFLTSEYNAEKHGGKYNCWHIYEKMPETEEWAIYPNEDKWAETDVKVIKVGFDAGKADINSVLYAGKDGNSVTIRTNSYKSILNVNAPSDEVDHYGKAKEVNVIRVKFGTYNEYGDVIGNINLSQGKVNVTSQGSVSNVIVTKLTDENETVVSPTSEGTGVTVESGSTVNAVIADESASSIDLNKITSGDVAVFNYDANAVAIIGSTSYASLDAALTAAQKSDTIVLLQNIEVATKSGTIEGYDPKVKFCYGVPEEVSIDGNGKTITATGNGGGYVFYFINPYYEDGATYNVKNLNIVSTKIQSIIITNQWASNKDLVNLANVNVTCDGECVYANGFTSVSAEYCKFVQNGQYASGKDAVYYSAVITGYGGKVTLRNCELNSFSNGVATFPSGGTINLYNTKLEITGEDSFAFWSRIGNGSSERSDSIINIFSGTYGGKFVRQDTSSLYDSFINVYGGSFDKDPTDYVNTQAYKVVKDGSRWIVSEK